MGGHDKMDGLPELHHSMSNSRNDPVQLASFSSSSTQDPAAKVTPMHLFMHQSSHLRSRILSISFASISSAGFLARVLTVMTLVCLQMKNGTQSEWSITQYFRFSSSLQTTPHMTSVVIAT